MTTSANGPSAAHLKQPLNYDIHVINAESAFEHTQKNGIKMTPFVIIVVQNNLGQKDSYVNLNAQPLQLHKTH